MNSVKDYYLEESITKTKRRLRTYYVIDPRLLLLILLRSILKSITTSNTFFGFPLYPISPQTPTSFRNRQHPFFLEPLLQRKSTLSVGTFRGLPFVMSETLVVRVYRSPPLVVLDKYLFFLGLSSSGPLSILCSDFLSPVRSNEDSTRELKERDPYRVSGDYVPDSPEVPAV